jgi:uncharacterized membrane protein
VRDHLHRGAFTQDPTDLAHTTPALFLTRWITHFCAPAFVFLAGTGAFLSGSRGRSRADLSRFLLTRGLWLVLLELTVVNSEWSFGWNPSFLIAQVIWALGWSMVVLAALVHLPVAAIAAIGWGMIALHNACDGVRSASLGSLGWLWTILHVQQPIGWGHGNMLMVMYPLVPWIGVMAAGYAFGAWLLRTPPERRRVALRLGAVLTAAFLLLRLVNLYGDPKPWLPQRELVFTVLSFINCQKYPPSLLFLLMTLGPTLILLAAAERRVPGWLRPVVVFGRVPLFYYVVHLLVIDLVTVGFAVARYGPKAGEMFAKGPLPEWGYGLPLVYLVWIALVVGLYPVCRWYAAVRARSRSPLFSYL